MKSSLPTILALLFAAITIPLRLLSAFGRMPFNMQPVGGLGVYSGARVRSWLAYVLPLAVMIATDCVLWICLGEDYSPLHVSRPWAYGAFLLYVLLGRLIVTNNNPLRIGAAALAGSLSFFIITNFPEWLALPHLYSQDLSGLLACYEAAWPFYRMTLVGDLAFTAIFFTVHEIVARSVRTQAAEVSS